MSSMTLSQEETLREQLVRSVTRLRTALAACPALDYLTEDSLGLAETQVAAATEAFADVTDVTTALGALVGLSQEAVYLLASSEMALIVVGDALAVITAQLDSAAAAA